MPDLTNLQPSGSLGMAGTRNVPLIVEGRAQLSVCTNALPAQIQHTKRGFGWISIRAVQQLNEGPCVQE